MKRIVPRITQVFCAFLCACTIAGCGPTTGTITGVVTYKDKPVASAQVDFIPSTGQTITVITDANGNYTASNVPKSTCKITVVLLPDADESQAQMRAGKDTKSAPIAAKGPKKIVLPTKYSNPSLTPLSLDVTGGPQPFNISIVD